MYLLGYPWGSCWNARYDSFTYIYILHKYIYILHKYIYILHKYINLHFILYIHLYSFTYIYINYIYIHLHVHSYVHIHLHTFTFYINYIYIHLHSFTFYFIHTYIYIHLHVHAWCTCTITETKHLFVWVKVFKVWTGYQLPSTCFLFITRLPVEVGNFQGFSNCFKGTCVSVRIWKLPVQIELAGEKFWARGANCEQASHYNVGIFWVPF